ncbi:MAG: MATE family efflux transporter [Solobacterium sp.]|nr:MATE family efflux transporter [Solobacterium sp.]
MQNMTEGSLFSHLWRYAVPLLLANWLQLAYNAADSMIAGRFIGQDALAAEGIAAPVMNLVILAISGLCIGAGIFMSERFGARDMASFRKSLSAVLKAGIILSLLIAAPGFLLTPLILKLLAVPEEIFRITTIYQRITFIGVPFTFIYNALASAMKSVGDSKRPLRFLAICSVLNIILDLILLGVFHLGITTSALTTVFAQVFSAFLAARCMVKEMPDLIPHNEEWKTDTALLKRVMNYGLPSALQQAVQPIGKLLIQSQVNLLGVSTIAAFNAVSRVDSFALIPEQGIASAISTCIAQNRGANKPDRIRKGFLTGISMEFCYGILIGLAAMAFGSHIVALFIKGNGTAEVIREGTAYLSVMAWIYTLPGFTNGFQGYCRGVGKIPITILCTFIQISLRTIGTFLLAGRIGIKGIAAASGIGWAAMLMFEVPYVLHHMKTLGQKSE